MGLALVTRNMMHSLPLKNSSNLKLQLDYSLLSDIGSDNALRIQWTRKKNWTVFHRILTATSGFTYEQVVVAVRRGRSACIYTFLSPRAEEKRWRLRGRK
jgi:hypothetical protein